MYRWWVLLHVVGVFGFLMAHGASAAVAFRLRRERDPARIASLLDLSNGTFNVLYGSFLVLLAGGIVAGFAGHWWGYAWIWAAIGVLVLMFVLMYALAMTYYGQVRKVAGLPYVEGTKSKPAEAPGTAGEIDAVLSSSRPMWIIAIGTVGLLVIAWLMIVKPF